MFSHEGEDRQREEVGTAGTKGGKVDSKKPTADLTPFLSRADGWRDLTAREPKGRA